MHSSERNHSPVSTGFVGKKRGRITAGGRSTRNFAVSLSDIFTIECDRSDVAYDLLVDEAYLQLMGRWPGT